MKMPQPVITSSEEKEVISGFEPELLDQFRAAVPSSDSVIDS
jgi:hypothetical protein